MLGGTLIQTGIDSNNNGQLDAGEVTDEQHLCSTESLPFDGIIYQAIERLPI